MRVLLGIALFWPCVVPAGERSPDLNAYPFSLSRVHLLHSPFRRALQINRNYLLKLDPHRLLWPFYQRAGLPTKGERYGGWERLDCVGHILGHYLSACSLLYAATGDPECRKRVNEIVSELAAVQKKHGNGYAGPVRTEVWKSTFSGKIKASAWGLGGGYVPWYVLHKTFAGLIDAWTAAGNDRARNVVRAFADWAKRETDKLTDAQFQKMLRCEHGGMLEVMATLYALTGNKDYLALARRFDHRAILDPLAKKRDELTGKHVNTQVPKIIGAARLYEATGEKRYATIARFFWERAVLERSFAPGGVDYHEHFRAPGEEAKFLNWDSCETCAVYNMLKLTKHLFSWQPEARYMDYYERGLYNHILGSQDPKSGGFTYFYSLKPGHFKTYSTPFDSMWCCVGTGMENHTRYGESIFFHKDGTLWVNLFIPSELSWTERGASVRLLTAFPKEDTIRLKLSLKEPKKLTLKIRVPYWATQGGELSVNGTRQECALTPRSYASITRLWRTGDEVLLRLPMKLHMRWARDDKNVGVIMYGPLVLAGELGRQGMPENLNVKNNREYSGLPVPSVPVLVTEKRDPNLWVTRVSPDQLRWKTRGVGKPMDVTLIPLAFMHHGRYTVYWRFLTEETWQKEQAEREAERRRLRELEARTVDLVAPTAQQERPRNLQGERTYSGAAFGRRWRDARGGGWFSYDLKVLPDGPLDLVVTYWGGDTGNRVFDIQVDGRRIATQRLNRNKPGAFFDVTYPIPLELTQGKQKVTVRFQAHSGAMAGGVFGCRIVRRAPATSAAEERFKSLDPFYKQHVVEGGLLIVSSEKVSPWALEEVGYLVRKMLSKRPELLRRLLEKRHYVAVMAYNEMQTDLPECRRMSLWWAKRARGLGGLCVSCGEENLLSYPGDPYKGENIFIHEFAHVLHGAVADLDRDFSTQLRGLYEKAKASGRFRGYGMNTLGEFWAEGVQSWFDCNRRGGLELLNENGKVLSQINTREQLKKYMPEYANLLDRSFGHTSWVYVPVLKRLKEQHLRFYDPKKAPAFSWPEHVLEAYNRIEAEKAKRRRKKGSGR